MPVAVSGHRMPTKSNSKLGKVQDSLMTLCIFMDVVRLREGREVPTRPVMSLLPVSLVFALVQIAIVAPLLSFPLKLCFNFSSFDVQEIHLDMATFQETQNATITQHTRASIIEFTQGIQLVYASVALYGAYVLVTKGQEWYRLSHIPGPWTASFCKEWLIRKTWAGNVWVDLGRQVERFGMKSNLCRGKSTRSYVGRTCGPCRSK